MLFHDWEKNDPRNHTKPRKELMLLRDCSWIVLSDETHSIGMGYGALPAVLVYLRFTIYDLLRQLAAIITMRPVRLVA